MVQVLNPDLIGQIRHYGAFDINACFNCGNCTAVCQLSSDANNFPRRVIRYGQVGMRDRMLADADLWMCYNCGECTATCPREADPAQFMAAARRYATAKYDMTGLSRLYYGSIVGRLAMLVVLSVVFTLMLLWHRGGFNHEQVALFHPVPGHAVEEVGFVSAHLVHNIGIGIFVIVGLAAVGGIASMIYRFVKATPVKGKRGLSAVVNAAIHAVRESLGQMRYQKCDADKIEDPWYLRPWMVHATVLWGFLAMLIATTLDYLFRPIGLYVPIWNPVRILGSIGGLVCLYGLAIIFYRRLGKKEAPYKASRFDDWFFPVLLAATVLTGLITEVVVYLPPTNFSYVVFLVHVVLAMDLMVLLPLTKFSHAVYRPLALALTHWSAAPVLKPAVAAKAEA